MILLVDAGNSRTKWATLTADVLTAGGACANAELASLQGAWQSLRPARALLACVADAATRARLLEAVQAAGATAHWLQAAAHAHGIDNPYRPPASLGADRYAALAAARGFAQDCLVVSVGTAMTADLLTRDGRFLGGCIVPGPDLMRAALQQGTAGVGAAVGEVVRFPLATGDAVSTGIVLALAGVVRSLRQRLAESVGATPLVVLTGGAGQLLRPLLDDPVQEVEDLVLRGLAGIAREMGWTA